MGRTKGAKGKKNKAQIILDIVKKQEKVEPYPDNKKEEIPINSELKKTVNELTKQFGHDVIHFASEEPERERIPTGIAQLDKLIGGGIITGSFQILWGNSAVGKTTISYCLIANAQKLGKTCIYFDMEGSFNGEWAKKFGVNLDKLLVAHVKTAEEAMDALINLSQNKVIDFCVIDSVQAMSPHSEQEEKSGKERSIAEDEMALLARKLSKFFRVSASGVYRGNVAVLLICQARTNLSAFIKLDTLSSGHALQHWSVLTLKAFKGSKADAPRFKYEFKGKKKDIIIGSDFHFKIEKTKINNTAPEGTEINVPFYNSFGFERPSEETIKETYSEWISFENE
jgi:recombination protein RecA